MPILTVLLVLVIVGVVLYLLERFVPMDNTIRWIIRAVVIIVLIVWLLRIFGVWGAMENIKV